MPIAAMPLSNSMRKPRRTGLGSVSRPSVAGLPPPCGNRDAGHEFSDVSGVATPPWSGQTGSSTRPFFPLGPIGVGVLCQRYIGKGHGGCATKLWCGGSPRSSLGNYAHLESDKVVLGPPGPPLPVLSLHS